MDEIAQSATVIRGSSRANSGSNGSYWNAGDRTPASVAGVLLGQRLNHFLLEDFIGGGGMGAVFRAHDEQLDRTVAIKVIPFVGDDADLKRRFRNEAQSAAKLDHPRIAKVFDVGSDDDWHYIVFEYIEGINIRDLVSRDGVLPIDEAVFYTCQLADAIQHAADRGIVHRDIKPSNVLIGSGDTIKLVDMGLARSESLDLSEDMTASGVTLGTFDYISPEQANDPRDADLRSDIYSLGCTLYFMLVGEPPYPGGTMLQKLINHGKTPPPDVRLLRTEVSEDLAAVIQKMLAKRPEDRFQHANDLIADLQEVAHREGLQRVQTLGPVAVQSLPPLVLLMQRHTPWLVAFSILLLVAGVLAISGGIAKDDFAISVPERETVMNLLPDSARPLPKVDPNDDNNLPPTNMMPDRGSNGAGSQNEGSQRATEGEGAGDADTLQRSAASSPRIINLPVPKELKDDFQIGPTLSANGEAGSAAPPRTEAAMTEAGEVSSPPMSSEGFPRAIRVTRSYSSDHDFEEYAYTRSLDQAIELANDLEVDRIELAEPLIRSAPIKIDRDGLVITSSVGGSVVVFESEEASPMQRVELIDLGSNRIEFEDLHFVWTVPVGSMGGGCLISSSDNRLIRMIDCSVTINNPVRHLDVFAFDISTERTMNHDAMSPGIESTSGLRSLPMVSIEMYNVCIRGQMTMLRMDVAAELQLRWENGLLAVSGQMIQTAGALVEPLPSARPIQLSLERLIAMAPRGLLRMRLDPLHPYPLQIDREANNCVFLVNPGVPIVEVSGLDSLRNSPPVLVLRGEANAYDTAADLSDCMLRLVDTEGKEQSVLMVDVTKDSPAWAKEQSPRWAVDWTTENVQALPANQLKPADFRQYGAVISGFSEPSLTIMKPSELDGSKEEI
ncbi:Serine/threonine-protein kinase PrkC [Novipirellula artificiosorum]|uniref:Serine/threonine-protein kinase PrkC n=2 Tax=Novipirellula artificiosorum TaxID=2528016 RepID=A0A5C6DKA2_9BACT|nr:Serine/threonine-protein kinase PrkC [Novipirellula artificiosorum]